MYMFEKRTYVTVQCHISEFISLKNYKLHNNWTEVGMMHTFLLKHARGKLVQYV